MSRHRLYRIWNGMKKRCCCETTHNYSNYGGRGITICEEWGNNFEAFRNWAVANGYEDNLSIDRIDVNGNYEPSNCRWASNTEQHNNTRKTLFVELNGEMVSVADLARKTGLTYWKLYKRLKSKIPIEKAIQNQDLRRGIR